MLIPSKWFVESEGESESSQVLAVYLGLQLPPQEGHGRIYGISPSMAEPHVDR